MVKFGQKYHPTDFVKKKSFSWKYNIINCCIWIKGKLIYIYPLHVIVFLSLIFHECSISPSRKCSIDVVYKKVYKKPLMQHVEFWLIKVGRRTAHTQKAHVWGQKLKLGNVSSTCNGWRVMLHDSNTSGSKMPFLHPWLIAA